MMAFKPQEQPKLGQDLPQPDKHDLKPVPVAVAEANREAEKHSESRTHRKEPRTNFHE